MPKVRIQVIESGGDFFVHPPTVSAEVTDTLRLINTTNEDLLFRFSTNGIVGAGDQTKIVASGTRVNVAILNTAPLGAYVYQIIMIASGKKAKGNSDPVLIIDN